MAYNRKNITQQHLEKRIRALMARLPVQLPVQADALRQIAAMQQPTIPPFPSMAALSAGTDNDSPLPPPFPPAAPGSELPRGPMGTNEMAPPLLPPSPPGIPPDPSMITGVGPGARSRPSPIQPRGPVAPAMGPQQPGRQFDRGPVGLPMGPGDASLAPPLAAAPPSPAAIAAPKTAAASTDPWANLLQFGLALMAGGDVQPGAARGPTFAGALGQAGLATMGDMRTRAALARKEAKEDAAAAEATRRFGLTYGLSKEELGVKKEQVKETTALKEATLAAKVQQDKLANEVAMMRNQIGLANVGEAQKANAIRSVAAYETAMGKLIERNDYMDADPPRQKAMRNEVRGRFNQSPEPTRPEDDPAAMAIKEALRKGDIKAEDARKKLKDLGYQ